LFRCCIRIVFINSSHTLWFCALCVDVARFDSYYFVHYPETSGLIISCSFCIFSAMLIPRSSYFFSDSVCEPLQQNYIRLTYAYLCLLPSFKQHPFVVKYCAYCH